MTRLTFHILLRIGLVCGALLGLLLTGMSNDTPALTRIHDFTVCQLPCWAGVTPLETAFEDAANLIDSNLPLRVMDFRSSNEQISFAATQGSPQIYGVVYNDRGEVNALRLEIALPVWMLIDLLGKPTCARTVRLLNSTKDSLTVYWEGTTHSIVSVLLIDETERWTPGAPTRYMFITAFNNECALLDAPNWQGFTPLWHYRVG